MSHSQNEIIDVKPIEGNNMAKLIDEFERKSEFNKSVGS